MINFEVLTLFPDMINNIAGESILGRAVKSGVINVTATNIRDYADNKHRRVDDTPYGGGFGMVMSCQPAVDCIRDTKKRISGSSRVIYLSPQGQLFDHKKALELSAYENLILLCGHYEGIDERIIELEVDEEISIGNYVLTGGELPAMVIIDSVARLGDGVLKSKECYEDESIASGMLEYPQYTKPRVFEELEVPEVLLNGNHAMIDEWRRAQSVKRTRKKRPDLLGE